MSSSKTSTEPTVNREEAILAAAKHVFLQKGFAGARMQEIAEAADINKAMLHYYFRSKQALFQKIFYQALDIMIPTLSGAISSEGSSIERLERVVDGYMDVLTANPHVPVFVLHEISNNKDSIVAYLESRQTVRDSIQSFFKQVMQDVQAGVIAPVNPMQLILNAMSMTIFPFVAKPFISFLSGVDGAMYDELLSDRAAYIKQTLRASIVTQKSPQ